MPAGDTARLRAEKIEQLLHESRTRFQYADAAILEGASSRARTQLLALRAALAALMRELGERERFIG